MLLRFSVSVAPFEVIVVLPLSRHCQLDPVLM
jgi:hypothetical protein